MFGIGKSVLKNKLLYAVNLFSGSSHAFIEPFQDARNHSHDCRTDFADALGDMPRRIGKVNLDSVQGIKIDRHALKGVRHRQNDQANIFGAVHFQEIALNDLNLRKHIAVCKLNPLGRSRRTARIDNRKDVIGAKGMHLVVQPQRRFGLLRERLAFFKEVRPVDPVRRKLRFRIDADYRLETRHQRADGRRKVAQPIKEQHLHHGIIALKNEVFRRNIREKRNNASLVELAGHIGHNPFGAAIRNDSNTFARRKASIS